MEQESGGLTSSVQVLSLVKGLYLVSVKSAAPQRVGDEGELALPAIHVGSGPGAPTGQIEIVTGPRDHGAWLYENRDVLVVKVINGPASVLITSLRTPTLPSMEVEVKRLDGRPAKAAAAPTASGPLLTAPSAANRPTRDAQGRSLLRTRIALHIQNRGEVIYVDDFWAGALGERLAIESFAISPLEQLRAQDIEYKAISETGEETAWIAGPGDCGSRGLGVALTGFAVRIRGDKAERFTCEYRGSFSSGKIIGPVTNGAACRSGDGDRLEAMQLVFLEAATRAMAAPILAQSSPAGETRVIGPRFSVFRENVE